MKAVKIKENHTIRSTLQEGINLLRNNHIDSAELDARLLFQHVTRMTREEIFLNKEHKISSKLREKFYKKISERELGKPVSKIIGTKEFYGLDFYVNSDVLDPRPCSELIVDIVLGLKGEFEENKELTVIDLGTGTACLAISLAKNLHQAKVTGVDISESALNVAKENIKLHNVVDIVKLVKGDWADLALDSYDIVVSNPPYIISSDLLLLESEVWKYDPLIALDGGDDGLDCYRILSKIVPSILKKGGYFVVEIGANMTQEVIDCFSEKLELVAVKKDLSLIDRCLVLKSLDV